MPLSWNEIRDRALRFSRDWADETSEDAEAKSFWDAFFEVFGVSRRRVASFEQPVHKADGRGGFIDLLWKGILLVEHKSRGKDLDRAFKQATDYFPGLKERDLPKYVLVSDFARLRLFDLDSGEQHEIALAELHRNVALFGFIAGYQVRAFKEQDPANIKAAERMGALHDALKASGFEGHALEVLLVRLLFCLFAEDTGIFERRQFQDFIETRTDDDGSDLGARLSELFHALNTPRGKRQKALDESIAAFEYVNGALFAEILPPPAFDRALREALLNACALDWSRISPAIFGALFQSIMDAKARRNLGAHYTSEKNILKLIGPLFMDGLRTEFDKLKGSRARLHEFHDKLAALAFLDPACGCGNFLVIAYRELRLLEHEVIFAMYRKELDSGQVLDPRQLIRCNVDRFHGIEIEEFPAQIAQVAMWLTDHQMNLRVQEAFGNRFVRLPLVASATIVHGNALRIDWNEVVPRERLSFILGNPPFAGKKEQSREQKTDLLAVFSKAKGAGVLDYVACWYLLAARYIAGTEVECAFVATNSITQGEQVGLLWPELRQLGIHINFAHRTFKWSNEARGKAAVYCVIVGFSTTERPAKQLFEYETPNGEPHAIAARRINAYLVDAEDVILPNRKFPISGVPQMNEGSALIDDGHLVLSEQEADDLRRAAPVTAKWIKPLAAGSDYINGNKRLCLWLDGASPSEVKSAPAVLQRVQKVREFRERSAREATRRLSATPTLFGEVRQPRTRYVMLPKTSSERRSIVPMGYLDADNIINNTSLYIENASTFHLGVLLSTMHMAWLRNVGGRLKSDYRYSAGIVYNNFPWPVPALPSPSGGRWPEGPDEGELSQQSNPSSGAARHLLPKGEGKIKTPLPAEALAFARALRQEGTDAEQHLWHLLRDRRLGGFKFRRQHPLEPYVLDFYCDAQRLAVELDGGQHLDATAADARRDAYLRSKGIRVLRFWNDAVFKETGNVLTAIRDALHEGATPSSGPAESLLPQGEDKNRHVVAIEAAAQAVLDTRAQFPDATLADLYDPLSMPPALVKAHQQLDKAVDAAYLADERAAGRKAPKFDSDAERIAFLFERYQALTSLLPAPSAKRRQRRSG